MTKGNTSQKVLFPADVPAENVVKAVLVMLQSYHECALERLNDILAGLPAFYTDKLAATWLRIQADSQSDIEALGRFTEIVAAELDGGNSPA